MQASTLRPRTRRLISGLDEGDEVAFNPATAPHISIASPALDLSRRSKSPIPTSHLPRPTSSYDRRLNASSSERVVGARTLGQDSGTSLERLWGTSWTAIQGIASDLLGSSAQSNAPLAKGKVSKPRRVLERGSAHRSSASAPPLIWGPKSSEALPLVNDVGTGTSEENEAAFRAKKRLDLLTGHESTFTDSMGRYKRRTSDESVRPTLNQDGDALVYVHLVQSGDTLAGISLRYSCPANVVRKANRLWPNDPIHIRTRILLPVDACGIKGRPTTAPEEIDLLGDENAPIPAGGNMVDSVSSLPAEQSDQHLRPRSDPTLTQTTADRSSSRARSIAASDVAWQHNSWAILPGSDKPIEIARLSRQALGYFPPARRKSQTFSDVDAREASFDRPRSIVAEAFDGPSTTISQSPSRRAASAHSRRLSTMTANGNHKHLTYLTGPGGVGSMDRNVRAPGPPPDSLNLMFAKHLPDVAPPRNQLALHQPELPLFSDDATTPTASGMSTPSAHNNNNNKNLEQVGGTIEAWMRRVASKAKDAMEGPDRRHPARASVGAPARGARGIGDLIEMTDEFEIGSEGEGDGEDHTFYDDLGRGRPASSILDQGRSSAQQSRHSGTRQRVQDARRAKND